MGNSLDSAVLNNETYHDHKYSPWPRYHNDDEPGSDIRMLRSISNPLARR